MLILLVVFLRGVVFLLCLKLFVFCGWICPQVSFVTFYAIKCRVSCPFSCFSPSPEVSTRMSGILLCCCIDCGISIAACQLQPSGLTELWFTPHPGGLVWIVSVDVQQFLPVASIPIPVSYRNKLTYHKSHQLVLCYSLTGYLPYSPSFQILSVPFLMFRVVAVVPLSHHYSFFFLQ